MGAGKVLTRMLIAVLAVLLIAGCHWKPRRPGNPTAPQEESQHELPAPRRRSRQAVDTSDSAWLRAAPRGQLPTFVRAYYFEGWRATGYAPEIRHKDFLEHVKQLYPGLSDTDRERPVRAGFIGGLHTHACASALATLRCSRKDVP